MADSDDKKTPAPFVPLFMQPDYAGEVHEVTWVKPKPEEIETPYDGPHPLNPRQREVCRLAAMGMPQKEIADKMDYTQSRISLILSSERGQRELSRIMDKIFDRSVGDRIKELGTPAMDVFEDILTTNDPDVKAPTRLDAAKWVAEKLTGKAKQEIEVGGNIVVHVLDQIKLMRDSGQIIDLNDTIKQISGDTEVTEPTEEELARKKLDSFLDSDL